MTSEVPLSEVRLTEQPPLTLAWIDTADRSAVVAAFDAEFALATPALGWNGDHQSCEEGTSSAASRTATFRRVNYYRAMAGVPATVTEDPTFSAKAQIAAIMMSVEGTLTHSPAPSFACFNTNGQQAAANSNLYLGRTGPEAIDGYIEDPGTGNSDVGHRNTILHPPTEKMGVGNVASAPESHSANALWVFDDRVFDETLLVRPPLREPYRFVAWPPRGYVPSGLVYPRWSFMMAGVDFSEAEVTVYDHGVDGFARRVPLVIVDRTGAAGHVPLPTIVWEPEIQSGDASDTAPNLTVVDKAYLVVVSGVRPLADPMDVNVSDFDRALLAASKPVIPTRFAYTVRVLGDAAGDGFRTEHFLGSIARA